MGGGYYSITNRTTRAESSGYYDKSRDEIFTQRTLHNEMSPKNAQLRESCDSAEHPNSVAIILGLDVTGSMGSIPHHLVKDGLPHIMGNIIQHGINDPQLLFLGIGDHECDRYPLQVGQFESSDELLDKWLTTVYLEGGGGGNEGESYHLAWYFAGEHTKIDCMEKRKKKGFLFTIGDEPCLKELPKNSIENIMGNGHYNKMNSMELLDKAREMYHVYHLHIKQGSNGNRQPVMDGWKQLMGDNLIIVDNYEDIPKIISEIVVKEYGNDESEKKETKIKHSKEPHTEVKEEEIL